MQQKRDLQRLPPIASIVRELEAIDDPDERWRAALAVNRWARELEGESVMVRARVVHDWTQQGHSYREIAGWYGLTRSNAQRLAEVADGRRPRSGRQPRGATA